MVVKVNQDRKKKKKFKPKFQKYKAQKCNTFYQRKRVKSQYFWETSFWLIKLVIRTHFKHQIQCVMCVTCEIHLISLKLALLNGINTYETTFCTFWFYLIPKSVFEVFIEDLYMVLHS